MLENSTETMIFINNICVRDGDMAWIIQPPIKRYHTKDRSLIYKKSIIDILEYLISMCFLFSVVYIHKETNHILCYNFTY